MNRNELEQLLGGYATGTLTESERKALFEAALTDQALFNALADEQALKELLDDQRARRHLLRVLEERPGLLARLRAWCVRPASLALAGGLATAVLAVTTVTRLLDIVPPPSEVTEEAPRTRAMDEVTAGGKLAAPKKMERREPAAALEKAVREAEVKQDKNEVRPSVAAAPEAKPAPAAQPPAKAPAAPTAEPLARSDAARSVTPGARALFYGAKQKEEAPARERRAAEPQSLSGIASDEQAAGAPVQRLGLRYGIVPREEGPALAVEINQRGYLYAAVRDATGATTLIHPPSPAGPQAALVEPGARYFIPPLGALPAGRLTLVLSRVPLADPLVPATAEPAERKTAALREDTPEPLVEGVRGPTVYIVEASPSTSSTLSVEIPVPAR